MAEQEKDASAQLREIRANIFGSVFDRVVWLDAAALSAIFVALHSGYAKDGQLCLISAGIWALCGSLLVTLCIAPYRALMSARHQHTDKYRFVWESYIGQLVAAIATGVGIVLAVAGFLCSVRGA